MPDNEQEQVPDYIQQKLKAEFNTPEEMIAKPEGPAIAEKPKRSPLNRVTIVEHIYHQVEGDDNKGIVAKYARPLTTNVPAYTPKNLTVGEEWVPIGSGDIKPEDVSVFVIVNTTGTRQQRIPSQEEQLAIEASVIEVGRKVVIPEHGWESIVDIAHVLVRQHCHIDPSASVDQYYIRCLSGTAKYNLFIIPK